MATDPTKISGPTYCQSYNDPRCPIRARKKKQYDTKKEDCRTRVCAPGACVGHINPPVLFLNPSCLQAPAPARPGPRNHVHAPLCPQCRKGCILLAATRMAHSELARARLGRAGASGGIPDGPVYRPNQRCHVPGGKSLCISTNVLPRTVQWQKQRETWQKGC